MEKVTAVILCYRREQNMPLVMESLIKYPWIDEYLIWNNSGLAPDDPSSDLVYARFLLAQKAKNEIIYTQDDDVLVDNLTDLRESYDKTGITFNFKRNELDPTTPDTVYAEEYQPINLALLGWGSLFQKAWIHSLDDYINKFGCDRVLKREADRIFTIAVKRKHTCIPVKINHLPGAENELALCKQPEHMEYKQISIQRALSL